MTKGRICRLWNGSTVTAEELRYFISLSECFNSSERPVATEPERLALEAILMFGGNMAKAARALHLSPNTVRVYVCRVRRRAIYKLKYIWAQSDFALKRNESLEIIRLVDAPSLLKGNGGGDTNSDS